MKFKELKRSTAAALLVSVSAATAFGLTKVCRRWVHGSETILWISQKTGLRLGDFEADLGVVFTRRQAEQSVREEIEKLLGVEPQFLDRSYRFEGFSLEHDDWRDFRFRIDAPGWEALRRAFETKLVEMRQNPRFQTAESDPFTFIEKDDVMDYAITYRIAPNQVIVSERTWRDAETTWKFTFDGRNSVDVLIYFFWGLTRDIPYSSMFLLLDT